jgi:type III restriction enzyme
VECTPLAVVSEGPLKGERMDDPATVHQVNVLTVVASESYKDFVSGLQKDISESLSEPLEFAVTHSNSKGMQSGYAE